MKSGRVRLKVGLVGVFFLVASLWSAAALARGPVRSVKALHYQVLVADQVAFNKNQSHLSRGQASIVDLMASWLKENPEMQVTVQGHCDVSERKAEKLSVSRAESVRKRLMRRGVDGERLKVEGFASNKPMMAGSDRRSQALNRRVEFYVVRIVTFEEQIDFKPGSAAPISTEVLDEVAQRINKNEGVKLQIHGHAEPTEDRGDDAVRALSLSRARKIRDELVRRGVDSSRLLLRALGSSAFGRSDHNRRVAFSIVAN